MDGWMDGWMDGYHYSHAPDVMKRVAHFTHPLCDFLSDQMSSRQKVEASLRQLEMERALLQHQSAENLRKVEIEADRKRSLENEREHLGNILS